ncbi:capping protein inhibiting regulator of actin dynamics isoform X2 [Latimeria chalumnae]|uniref:capping protein inhibiting regulator of actin dynamics isoform X2 n=1 Tax=Latimeria chalumnae TaxID=7897 RepID=UPI00313D4873
MGTRAFSHDSIFIPDGSMEDGQSVQATSQENIPGKVKTLQQQLAKNIKFGQPPISANVKRMEDAEITPEDSDLPTIPMEIAPQEDIPESAAKVTPVKSSRPKRPYPSAGTIESINLDAVPLSVARLDNTAAKHKLSVKPKNQRVSKKHRKLTENVVLQEVEQENIDVKSHEQVMIKQEDDKERVNEDEQIKHVEEYRVCESKKKKRLNEEKEQQHLEAEESKKLAEEQRRLEEQRQKEAEEQEHLEEEEKQRRLEEQRQETEERLHLEEEERKKQEEQKWEELEEQRREIEEKRQEEQRQRDIEEQRQEEQRQREIEEQIQREIEEQRQRETEEQRQREIEEQRQEEQRQREIEEKRQEEQRQREIEENRQQKQHEIEQKMKEELNRQQEEGIYCRAVEHLGTDKMCQEEEKSQQGQQEEELRQEARRQLELQERMGEELRWQEVEQRQTMPRPFTFKVSSGEKQIIFQKVNLTPVSPLKERTAPSDVDESKPENACKGSHSFPSSLYAPHTAILVTGAQLCGTAVSFNQIKDTACKSLLGQAEEKKNADFPPIEKISKHTRDAKAVTSKNKYTQETRDNQSILVEWTTIRSKILKNAENGKVNKKERKNVGRLSDDYTPKGSNLLHSDLRKTVSANAKFSITPAWQKFPDTNKGNNDENANIVFKSGKENIAKDILPACESAVTTTESKPSGPIQNVHKTVQDKIDTHVRIADNSEGCKFAKDLPSFLVPSLPHIASKGRSQSESQTASSSDYTDIASPLRKVEGMDKTTQNSEEKSSPFGVKLRRTNYSLRFHYEQPADQKRKKRYSAGDSFEGVPAPLILKDSEKEATSFPKSQLSTDKADTNKTVLNDSSNNVFDELPSEVAPVVSQAKSHASSLYQDKQLLKPILSQKPSLAPKPACFTPPSSPIGRTERSDTVEVVGQRTAKADSDTSKGKEDSKAYTFFPPLKNTDRHEEEETKEKKCFFPSISIPWRERSDRKSEQVKREKPVLQSRHSLDSSRLMEKVESAQPLWITLALQKQKGFREQQATREERRQAREAKQAEKLAKEHAVSSSSSDSKGSNNKLNTMQKSAAKDEDKKTENILVRVERREQLKKSNTLPNSVTAELALDPRVQVTQAPAETRQSPSSSISRLLFV